MPLHGLQMTAAGLQLSTVVRFGFILFPVTFAWLINLAVKEVPQCWFGANE